MRVHPLYHMWVSAGESTLQHEPKSRSLYGHNKKYNLWLIPGKGMQIPPSKCDSTATKCAMLACTLWTAQTQYPKYQDPDKPGNQVYDPQSIAVTIMKGRREVNFFVLLLLLGQQCQSGLTPGSVFRDHF